MSRYKFATYRPKYSRAITPPPANMKTTIEVWDYEMEPSWISGYLAIKVPCQITSLFICTKNKISYSNLFRFQLLHIGSGKRIFISLKQLPFMPLGFSIYIFIAKIVKTQVGHIFYLQDIGPYSEITTPSTVICYHLQSSIYIIE